MGQPVVDSTILTLCFIGPTNNKRLRVTVYCARPQILILNLICTAGNRAGWILHTQLAAAAVLTDGKLRAKKMS